MIVAVDDLDVLALGQSRAIVDGPAVAGIFLVDNFQVSLNS